jgi:SAM-dependent methyltransferase
MNLRWRLAQFFEIRWWRRYLAPQHPEAYLEWKKAYWRRLLDRHGLWPPAGAAVLDAGCGPAGIFTVLDGCAVDAVDPLLDRYAATLPHFRPGAYPGVRFFTAMLETFEPGRKYDTVFCLNAINHVADLPAALRRLAALLDPGGRLVLAVDVHRHPFLKRAFRLLPADVLHPHQHTMDDYRAMLEAAGLAPGQDALIRSGKIFEYRLVVCSGF